MFVVRPQRSALNDIERGPQVTGRDSRAFIGKRAPGNMRRTREISYKCYLCPLERERKKKDDIRDGV